MCEKWWVFWTCHDNKSLLLGRKDIFILFQAFVLISVFFPIISKTPYVKNLWYVFSISSFQSFAIRPFPRGSFKKISPWRSFKWCVSLLGCPEKVLDVIDWLNHPYVSTLRIHLPLLWKHKRPSVHDTPKRALKQVVLTPHDIWRILRVG